ncbi:hypothetical protein ABIF63_003388 [Bradyrhizobium japonicum]|uniref:Uncharacterized protein n=2 Tax=Nitrobacteraceae TaxID=41294 RepID=A0ABV2RQP7_BRAJP
MREPKSSQRKNIMLCNNVGSDLIERLRSSSIFSNEFGAPPMIGFQAKLERFESLAAECELLAKKSDGSNRGLYLRAGQHYRELADDLRALIASFDVAA